MTLRAMSRSAVAGFAPSGPPIEKWSKWSGPPTLISIRRVLRASAAQSAQAFARNGLAG